MDEIKSSKNGFSLMSVIVAVGVLSTIGVGIMRLLDVSFKAQSSISLRADVEAIRRTILRNINCQNTLSSASCNGTINVLDHNGDVFISNLGRKFGKWTIKANCSSGNIYIKTAALKQGASIDATNDNAFNKDPLTNRILSWENKGNQLFADGVSPCELGNPLLLTKVQSFEESRGYSGRPSVTPTSSSYAFESTYPAIPWQYYNVTNSSQPIYAQKDGAQLNVTFTAYVNWNNSATCVVGSYPYLDWQSGLDISLDGGATFSEAASIYSTPISERGGNAFVTHSQALSQGDRVVIRPKYRYMMVTMNNPCVNTYWSRGSLQIFLSNGT